MPKFNRNKLDCNTIKYEFENSDKGKLTFDQFLTLLKSENQDFLKIFGQALNNATEELSAYFWECVPVSQKSLNKKFEFVVIKSEELDKISENSAGFEEYLAQINDYRKPNVISFPNKNKDAILTIPAYILDGRHVDCKNISNFIKNAPEKQKQEFWQAVSSKLSQELEKSQAPKMIVYPWARRPLFTCSHW